MNMWKIFTSTMRLKNTIKTYQVSSRLSFFHYSWKLVSNVGNDCFVHPIFRFWFLVTFGNEVTKIRKYYVIFVYILQGKMGKTEKNGKKITQLKWPKYQKPKNENMGWTKQSFLASQKITKFGIALTYKET